MYSFTYIQVTIKKRDYGFEKASRAVQEDLDGEKGRETLYVCIINL